MDFYDHTVFPTVEAAEAAVALLDDGTDFTFTLIIDPTGTGKAIIEVHDITDGALLGKF